MQNFELTKMSEATNKDKAMACNLFEKWEHVGCLKCKNKLLYEALVVWSCIVCVEERVKLNYLVSYGY